MYMQKISILSLHLGYGGVEKSIVALANSLCERYEVEIACTYKLYEKSVFPLNSNVKVKYLIPELKPNREKFKEALRKKKIIKIINEGMYAFKVLKYRKKSMINYIKNSDSDIIISTRDIFNEWLGEYGNNNILKIGWEHNHYHNNMKYADNVVRSASKLNYLVLVSNSLKDFYQERLRKTNCKCIYIPNTIDKIPKSSAPLKNKKLISIGRLSPEKGYLDLVKIYNVLEKKHPDWTLDIIGDGIEREKLECYIKQHNLESKIILHGFRDKDYIDKMLHEASIYLMTSHTESFGIVLIEAMSHGVPCIAFSSAEGARELIQSGKNGYLIKNRNYEMMIKKIEDLMEREREREKIGKASRKEAKKYTNSVVKKYWYDLIEKK